MATTISNVTTLVLLVLGMTLSICSASTAALSARKASKQVTPTSSSSNYNGNYINSGDYDNNKGLGFYHHYDYPYGTGCYLCDHYGKFGHGPIYGDHHGHGYGHDGKNEYDNGYGYGYGHGHGHGDDYNADIKTDETSVHGATKKTSDFADSNANGQQSDFIGDEKYH